MKKTIIKIIIAAIGAALGINFLPILWHLFGWNSELLVGSSLASVINAIIGAIIFFIISLFLTDWIVKLVNKAEAYLTKQQPTFVLFGVLFMILGLVLAALISTPLYRTNLIVVNTILPIILFIGLGYLGFRVGTLRRDDWRKLFQSRRRDNNTQSDDGQILARKADDNFRKYKILDTSVIIDGRIRDIAKTGFIEGTLLVPEFVVHELQLISDSADSLKRARGRRGLDILNEMKAADDISVEMYDGDFENLTEVDTKLIKLAKLLDGIVVTNDFNLNKVSEFQNVPVLNINALANALKPEILPGESLHVTVVKAGTERQQGVAYQEDGTMVVVEDGQYYLNQLIEVVVTSALQTSAGRMIFARPAHQQRGITDKAKSHKKDNSKKN
ncbi:PIN/TRAM domain-containing protein [Agrilactobacillus fermenti]|uniref:PIN/TRAM domain-containing protein n=1 Tax=Agrilactobacillus fermenti TaxID=2586909 RepID=UPI001E4CD890|nr:PIN domain-containing protein [Agrilactobacillus fermenti]MCD2255419.1 PIN domain nuclease [Agrilactobacillus fermenti]